MTKNELETDMNSENAYMLGMYVLIIMLYWSEKNLTNCTYLLPNTRSTHKVKNYFPPMTVHRFGLDPQ